MIIQNMLRYKILASAKIAVVKYALCKAMVCFNMLSEFRCVTKLLDVFGAAFNWTVAPIEFVSNHEMLLKFFPSLESSLRRTSMNIVSERLDNAYEMRMANFDMPIELVFARKPLGMTEAARIRTLEWVFL
jgi:hypothetical protein